MDTDFLCFYNNPCDERLNIKLTVNHKVALVKIARLESECMSVVVRNLIRQAAISHGVWYEGIEVKREKTKLIVSCDADCLMEEGQQVERGEK